MARKKRKSLIFTIMRMSVIPIAILGVVMTFYSQNSVHEGMVFEIEKSLSGIAHNLIRLRCRQEPRSRVSDGSESQWCRR